MQTRPTLSNGYVAPAHSLPVDGYLYAIEAREQAAREQANGTETAVLMLTLGPQAAVVAQQATQLSARWLKIAPLLWTVALHTRPNGFGQDKTEEIARELRTVCDQIATATTYGHENNGTPTTIAKTLKIWVILDIYTIATQATGDAGVTEWAEQARRLLQLLEVVVWQRLRITPAPEFFILAAAKHKAAVELCRRRLVTVAPTVCHLAGPGPDAWSPLTWQESAATALAALLWVDPPKQATRDNQPIDYVVGAAAWPIPVAAIKRTLALLTADAEIRRLLAISLAPPSTAAAESDRTAAAALVGLPVQQWLKAGEQLTTHPAPGSVNLIRSRPRWWRTAKDPTKILLTHIHIQQAQQHQAARQARHQWLATHLSSWDVAWRHFNENRLTSGDDHKTQDRDLQQAAGAYCRQLQELDTVLAVATHAADETLALLAEAVTAAEARVQELEQELLHLCLDLPTCSLSGIWRLCTHPTRWLAWFWQWTITLPGQLRRLSRALTAQTAAHDAEANAQTVRQLALGMWQDLRLQAAWVDDLRQQLTALAAYLAEQLAGSEQELPPPWDRARLAALCEQLGERHPDTSHNVSNTLARLLHREAQDEWADSTVEAISEELLAEYAGQFDPLDHWSVADWLASAFTPTSPLYAHKAPTPDGVRHRSPTVSALPQWLDQLAAQALPTWITPHAVPKVVQEMWLIMPSREQDRAQRLHIANWNTSTAQSSQQVEAWLQTQPNAQWVESPFQGLVLLRRVAVE